MSAGEGRDGDVKTECAWRKSFSTRIGAGSLILLLVIIVSGWWARVLVASTSASSGGTVVVCPSGPPRCDYGTIQGGVDAASAGDTVLVSPGTFAERVTLKSDIVLESSNGPETTTITATVGPILTAVDVVSTTVRGFRITGQEGVTLGLKLSNSNVALTDCVIEDLRGAVGRASGQDGEGATAIHFSGPGELVVRDSTIQDVFGGDGFYGDGATGGAALGIWAEGAGELAIEGTSIRGLTGGAAGTNVYWPYGCNGTGGRVAGIHTSGGISLTVSGSVLSGLTGGAPCLAYASYCVERAGDVVAIEAMSGTVTLNGNLLTDLSSWAAHDGEPSYAVHTSLTSETVLERNTIASLKALDIETPRVPASLDSHYCTPPAGSVIAIGSENDALVRLVDNSVTDLRAIGIAGTATGISVQGVTSVTLAGNSVTYVRGGSASGTIPAVTGIGLEAVGNMDISGNQMGWLRGGDAPGIFYYAFSGVDGGDVVGIALSEATQATITNNSVWALTGGRGSDCDGLGVCTIGKNGGDAIALDVSGGSAQVLNNTFYQTTAGLGGEPDGQSGYAAGLRMEGAADVLAFNNAFVGHGTGVWTTDANTPTLDYNNLWDNDVDYQGVAAGANDRHVPPGFEEAESGDFHIEPDSPLVDAGTNTDVPVSDFEGEPRRLDGDDDTVAVTDIGADEYWPGLRGSTKTVDRSFALPGESLSYQLTLVNPSSWNSLPVAMTDTLPSDTTYAPGSVWASAGMLGYDSGTITWTGTLSPGSLVTLTFSVTIDEALVGPAAVVNRAVLNDGVGLTRTLRAATLIDPLQYRFPLVFAPSP